jgi:xanthosine utilization system XapX-like protein
MKTTLFSFGAGLLVAVAFHFMLYRISLPLKPFIYVAF